MQANSKFRACVVIVLAYLLSSGLGCTGSGPSDTAAPKRNSNTLRRPIQIVTTVGMVSDIVRQIAGDKADVNGLLGEGVDPHLYKPTRNDVKRLIDADVVFYSGLLLEGRMEDVFQKVSQSGKPTFAVTKGIDFSYLRHPPEFSGHPDPHVWMDVSAWSSAAQYVADQLAEIDAEFADYYRSNAESYRAELERLDAYIRESVATIPEMQRVLITAHDAFGYFGRAYAIDVRAPQGISTESEASVEDINGLVDFIVERRIAALFVESSVNPKSIQAVIEGATSRGHKVTIGGQLFSDAMGQGGSYEGTYIGMMDHNATTIVRALGGKAPGRGFHGKLAIP